MCDGNNALYDCSGNGPSFGSGSDLCISNSCTSSNSSCGFPNYYYGIRMRALTGGANSFKVKELEVYKIEIIHNFNFGFALLKNILAFDVIITHCFNKNTAHNNTILFITKRRKVHVPSFFILSFYYNYNTLVSSNIKKKIYRLNRLLIPYI